MRALRGHHREQIDRNARFRELERGHEPRKTAAHYDRTARAPYAARAGAVRRRYWRVVLMFCVRIGHNLVPSSTLDQANDHLSHEDRSHHEEDEADP